MRFQLLFVNFPPGLCPWGYDPMLTKSPHSRTALSQQAFFCQVSRIHRLPQTSTTLQWPSLRRNHDLALSIHMQGRVDCVVV